MGAGVWDKFSLALLSHSREEATGGIRTSSSFDTNINIC